MSNSRKIWLIGADSFTGTHLLPCLEKGDYHVDTEEVDITDVNQVEDRILQSNRIILLILLRSVLFLMVMMNQFMLLTLSVHKIYYQPA